jgi:signal peptidase I
MRAITGYMLSLVTVTCGILSYFVRPFHVPTNSMYPAFVGENVQVVEPPHRGLWERTWSRLAFGRSSRSLIAPSSGKLSVLLRVREGKSGAKRNSFHFEGPGGYDSSHRRSLTFAIDDRIMDFELPKNADVGELCAVILGLPKDQVPAFLESGNLKEPEAAVGPPLTPIQKERGLFWQSSGRQVVRGENLISLTMRTGDLIIADCFSYNFVSPRFGESILFKRPVSNPLILPNNESVRDSFYLKRLIGLSGDELEIRDGTLFRNERKQIVSWHLEAAPGVQGRYTNAGLLAAGKRLWVPPEHYFALGDNSQSSADSRFWGPIEKRTIIGKAVFVYYPFSDHWGRTKE